MLSHLGHDLLAMMAVSTGVEDGTVNQSQHPRLGNHDWNVDAQKTAFEAVLLLSLRLRWPSYVLEHNRVEDVEGRFAC